LSTIVSGIPSTGSSCCGPLGSATNTSGHLVVQVYENNNYVFNDVDGQPFSAALSHASPAVTTTFYGMALTNDHGTLYTGNNDLSGQLWKLNNDGSLNTVVSTTPSTDVAGHGISTDPANGDIITSSSNGLWEINPTTGVARQIVNTGGSVDGVSVSADGSIVYGADSGFVIGWNISTGAQVFQSQFLGSPDGTGVITGKSKFAGDIVSNNNDGTVWLIDKTTELGTEIASGGSRGDYVGVDLTNGSLFLSQTNSLDRLSCGTGCGFVGPSFPEPSTWVMMLVGFAGLAFAGYRARLKSLAAETSDALALQAPLPVKALPIVAKGEKSDSILARA
jgi:hypothetical protein